METSKKTKKKSTAASGAALSKAYRKYVLTEGKKPASVFKFCLDQGVTESEFYSFYGSFEAIDKAIWKEYFTGSAKKVNADSSYSSFSAREKILSFYFALAEILKEDRSFALAQLRGWNSPTVVPGYLKSFKTEFDLWLNSVLNEGKQNGEIAKRPYLDNRYDNLFWLHLMFIISFWSRDDSPNFEKTDAAIEKSVNLAFDLMGNGVLDNALDFGKFLYQSAKK
jgi:Tetracyclin repressor-like, C-terminal domain